MARFKESYILLAAVLLTCVACSNPEKKVIGLWSGSGVVKPPSTGNPQVDAQMAALGPQTIGCNLDLKDNKSYSEDFQGYQIVGNWTLDGDTITLTPRTVNGRGVDAVKKQMDAAMAKQNVNMTMPGLGGAEKATVAQDGSSISVPMFGSQITLHKPQDAGTS